MPPSLSPRARAATRTDFTDSELAAIDEFAVEGGIDLWRWVSRFN